MMEENTKIRLSAWKKISPYVLKLRKTAVVILIFMIISSLTESVYPLFTSYAVNHFVEKQSAAGISGFIMTFAAVIILSGIAVVIYCHSAIVMEMDLGRLIKRDCFVHLQELPLSFYSTSSVGYLLARVMSDTERISGVIAWGILNFLWNFVYIVGAYVSMFMLNARLAAILLLLIPIVGIVTWLFQTKIFKINRHVRHINSKITGAYNEGITGGKAAKTLVIEKQLSHEFSEISADMYRHSMRASHLNAILIPFITLCGSVAVAAVLHIGGSRVMFMGLDYGVLSAFITYAVSIIAPITEVVYVFTDLNTAQVCVERVSALLDEECSIKDSADVIEKYGDCFEAKRENWEKLRGDIEFKNVSFKYPDGEEYVLENFDLKIPAGTTVAIVGETGAGKSTLVNLACRFYEPTSGQVLIDGIDVKERSCLWLHSNLGYVLQDPHLFSGSIADNIRYGRLEATEEEIKAAAHIACADTVAERMPDGYDTYVGEGGDRLSTGEKQLISFARAVIADPPLFVLDEATSSIDTQTEQLIQNAISNILSGRTSFIIAHRLSTIRRADLIIVVDKGKIVEQGTHDELMALCGHYAKLYEAMRIKEKQI